MKNGFTLIEVLVALVVLTLVVGVALQTQLVTLQAEQTTRAYQSLRLAVAQVFCEARLNAMEPAAPCTNAAGYEVQMSMVALGTDLEPENWMRWEIIPPQRPSLTAVLFTRVPEP